MKFKILTLTSLILISVCTWLCSPKEEQNESVPDTVDSIPPGQKSQADSTKKSNPLSDKFKPYYLKQMDPQAKGARSKESIRSFIMKNAAILRDINKRHLQIDKNLIGFIGYEFAITGDGNIIKCKLIESTVNCKPLEDDMTAAILKLKAPPIDIADDTTVVYWPFWFGS